MKYTFLPDTFYKSQALRASREISFLTGGDHHG